MDTIKKYKYKLIKNFFSKKELEILQPYCVLRLDEKWQTDPPTYTGISDVPYFYDDALMNYFHEKKRPLVEKHARLNLFRTYSFWRFYIYGSVLGTHMDRPSCEISVTACIKQSKIWPIHMNNNWIEMKEGDAVIYLGCEVPHGRRIFKHDHNAQVFLHDVDQNGPFAHHQYDQMRKDNLA